eukprot:5759807-Pyramimonas_sp.AAC.1
MLSGRKLDEVVFDPFRIKRNPRARHPLAPGTRVRSSVARVLGVPVAQTTRSTCRSECEAWDV